MNVYNKYKSILNNRDNKVIIYNILSSFFIKGAGMIISFLSLPAYLHYFDNEHILGYWFTVLAVLNWILTFDLGIGNGLRNSLVEAIHEDDVYKKRKLISSSYVITGLIVIFIFLIFLSIYREISWHHFFNIKNSVINVDNLNLSILILFTGILLQFFLRNITSILYALQKSSLNNLMMLVSNIVVVFFITIFKFNTLSESLIYLSLVYVIAINLPLLISTIIIFESSLKESKPRIKYFNKKEASTVLMLGGLFFGVQVLYMILTSTNEILISWFVSSEKVVEFQVYNRIFTLISSIFTLTLIPVWSMVTKAFIESNYNWINKLFNRFIMLGVVVILLQLAIIPFMQNIIDFWLDDKSIKVNNYYTFIFAILGSLMIWIAINSSFANGFGKLKIQLYSYTIGVIIKIPLSIFFIKIFDSWIGVVIATVISLMIYSILQPLWIKTYLRKQINKNGKGEVYVSR